jgi:hypothetical protein
MSGNVQELASTIENIVRERGQILGSHLATELKRREAGWSPAAFGVSSLRQFIADNVPNVATAGRSGMDVIYTPADAPAPAPPTPSASNEDIWRIWVSPHSHLALAIDKAGGKVDAVARDASPLEGKVVVPAPDVGAHREIARSFLTKVPEQLQERLARALEASDENWWRAWRGHLWGTEAWNEWSVYRREQFEKLLTDRLRGDGVDEGTIAVVASALRENRAKAAGQVKRAVRETNGPVARERPHDALPAPQDLRRLVTSVVQQLTDAELRELRLPLGVVLDALAALKNT